MPMRLVVADTGPINYLILIGAIEVLPKLFDSCRSAQGNEFPIST